MRIIATVCLAMAVTTTSFAKTAPTYYTPERVAHAKRNVEQFDWAKQNLATIKGGQGFRYYTGYTYGPADTYADAGDEFMWNLMPSTTIARHVRAVDRAQCPVHGDALRQIDPHCGYRINPITHPYQVQCMVGGEWYPNEQYPDDGDGCVHEGKTYYFLRTYAHMAYGSAVVQALRSLSQAWLITDDPRYARAGCILLAKLAMEYPNHGDRKDRLFYAKFPNFRDPDVGWKMGGMITDLIWENFALHATALAYDGLFNYMDRDPEMLVFLKSKGMPIDTGDDLRRYIEDHILRSGIEGLLLGNIHGNDGMSQVAAAAVAVALDDHTSGHPFNSRAAVDYIMHFQHPQWAHVAHGVWGMVNASDRSGGGYESPNYSASRLSFVDTNRILDQIRALYPDRYPVEKYPDLFAMPKFNRVYDYYLDVNIHGRFTPSIGDCGGITAPSRALPHAWSPLLKAYGHSYIYALQKYGDPRYARACTDINTGELATGDLFEAYPDAEIASALTKPESTIEWKSRLLDGYGVAILDSGDGDHRRAVMLNYTDLLGHYGCDQLHLQLYARGLELTPDLGYPTGWEYRWTWDSNSFAHNTVTIDETQMRLAPFGGKALLYGSAGGVHAVSAMHQPYAPDKLPGKGTKQNSLYQRTVVLVDVDESNYYVVDHFAADGGTQHDQSWHGMLVPMQPPEVDGTGSPIAWQPRQGTLAGEDVPQFGKWKDKWGRDRDDFPAFLTDIRTTELSQPAAFTWNSGLPEGDALKLHVIPVGSPLRMYTGGGRSPNRPADWRLDYLMARREVKNGAASQFLTVLDGYQGEPTVQSVKLVSTKPLVLEVTHAKGADTVRVDVPLAANRYDRPQQTSVQVVSSRGKVHLGESYAQSRIDAVNYERDRIAVAFSAAAEKDFAPGTMIRIYNAGRSAMYRVIASERDESKLWLTLSETAVYARAKIKDFADNTILLQSHLQYANGTEENANNFAAAWVGDGIQAIPVRSATKGENNNAIQLARPVSKAALKRRFPGETITVWQYGVGDQVEAARIMVEME